MSRPNRHPRRFVLRALTIAVATCGAGGVEAARLGGATVVSAPGEPLLAEVALLATPGELAAARASLSEPIGVGGGGAVARLGMRAVVDPAGLVRIESTEPLEAGAVELRLALHLGERTLVRHYRLAPSAPPLPARVRAAAAVAPPAAPRAGARLTVRRGDTAWGIARRLWPGRRDLGAAVAALVAANPHAFVDGDADRLLAGAVLTVPGALAAGAPAEEPAQPAAAAREPAPVASASAAGVATEDRDNAGGTTTAPNGDAATPTIAEGAVAAQVDAAATAAPAKAPHAAVDLEAVDRRLAAARAFLEARRSGRTATPLVATAPAPAARPAAAPVSVSAPAVAVQPQSAPLRADAGWRDAISLPRLAAGLSLALLLAFAHRWRRRAQAPAAAVDPARLQAIRAKAERAEPASAETAGMRIEVADGTDPLERSMAAVDDRADAGRRDDAVRALERVLTETTNTHRALLRLAELHYLTNQADDFARLAERLHREFRPRLDDAEWARVQEMGRRLCPGHPLFGGPVLVRGAS